MSRLLNLGCGHCHHPAFLNIDFTSTAPGVVAHDLRTTLPCPSESFDLVYHAHVLEHFGRTGGARLLGECFRVLAPGGLIRVVVPDLAQWARAYVDSLEELAHGHDSNAAVRHEWLQIELLDQMTRTRSGGEFLAFLRMAPPAVRPFVESRVGPYSEFLPPEAPTPPLPQGSDWKARWRPLVRWLRSPAARRESRLRRVLGPDFSAYETARFREQGELHLWMYDVFSLGRILHAIGFRSPTACDAHTSAHPNWDDFHLDTFPHGVPRRPNSLYLEARKPAGPV